MALSTYSVIRIIKIDRAMEMLSKKSSITLGSGTMIMPTISIIKTITTISVLCERFLKNGVILSKIDAVLNVKVLSYVKNEMYPQIK